MDRLDDLALYVSIIDAGSLVGAARRTRLSPASVTRRLGALEQRLGVRLLERNTRRIAPTEAGRRLASHARTLLADFENAMRDASGESSAPRGLLRLSAPLLFGRRHLAPVAMAYLNAYPEVSIELTLSDRPVDLIEEGVDVALRIAHLTDSSLVARRVGMVRRLRVASPQYLATAGTPRRPEDLVAHDIVLFFNHANSADWRFVDRAKRDQIVRVNARFSVNRAEAAIAAAREGHGVLSVLSYQVASELADGSLVRILRRFERPPIPVQLVVPTARLMPPRVRVFLDFAVPRLSALDILERA
ncbi:MAG: LysR family transcriptional regulator [Reyranella sp.]|nr:LysR family transcriptional regulator [Reyranella sp.]